MRAHAIKMKSSERSIEFMKTPNTTDERLHEGEDVTMRLSKLVQQHKKLVKNEVVLTPKLFNMKRGSSS